MFPLLQIELNIIQMYIRHVESVFTERNSLTDSFLYVLRVCEGLRECKVQNKLLDLDDLQKLKDAHRTAEHFLLQVDIPGAEPKRVLAEVTNILQLIALELHAEITATEARYPELSAEFARDKEEYWLQWNQYLEQYKLNTETKENESLPVHKRTRSKRRSTQTAQCREINY